MFGWTLTCFVLRFVFVKHTCHKSDKTIYGLTDKSNRSFVTGNY